MNNIDNNGNNDNNENVSNERLLECMEELKELLRDKHRSDNLELGFFGILFLVGVTLITNMWSQYIFTGANNRLTPQTMFMFMLFIIVVAVFITLSYQSHSENFDRVNFLL